MSDDVTTTDSSVDSVPAAKSYTESYVTQLRNEAAKYRVEKNEAVEAAKNATEAAVRQQYQSEVDGLTADVADGWVYAQKLHSAIEAIHPESKALDFASILSGSDPQSISASAEKARQLFGVAPKVTATDTTQGTGNSVPALNSNALLEKLVSIVGPPRS